MANPYREAEKAKKTAPGGNHSELKNKEMAAGENEAAEVQSVENVPATPVIETPKVAEQTENKAAEETIVHETASEPSSLAAIYADKRKSEIEPRTVRIQAVVTPSLSKKLDALANGGIIKSRNDLINFLLESYMETHPKELFEELLRKEK